MILLDGAMGTTISNIYKIEDKCREKLNCTKPELIKEIHEKYGDDLKIIKVDIEKHPDLANEYGISSIPSLLFFSEGKLIETKVGAMPKEGLVNWIDSELLADNDFDEQLKKDDSKSE